MSYILTAISVNIVPEVIFCPDDMDVYSEIRSIVVTWQDLDPIFTTNAIYLESNYESGRYA